MDWLTQARWRFGRIGAGACVMLAERQWIG